LKGVARLKKKLSQITKLFKTLDKLNIATAEIKDITEKISTSTQKMGDILGNIQKK
jgi:hypothetical protein